MRVFAISGFSGTGKTTLIEKLNTRLQERGYRIAVLKSTNEDIGPPEGTDTHRHLETGADPVILLGPDTTTIRHRKRLTWDQLLLGITADFLLIEGLKQKNLPRFFCIGNQGIDSADIPESTVAVITWKKIDFDNKVPLQVFLSTAIEDLVDIIEKQAVDSNDVKF